MDRRRVSLLLLPCISCKFVEITGDEYFNVAQIDLHQNVSKNEKQIRRNVSGFV
jgi:hypothetical protein